MRWLDRLDPRVTLGRIWLALWGGLYMAYGLITMVAEPSRVNGNGSMVTIVLGQPATGLLWTATGGFVLTMAVLYAPVHRRWGVIALMCWAAMWALSQLGAIYLHQTGIVEGTSPVLTGPLFWLGIAFNSALLTLVPTHAPAWWEQARWTWPPRRRAEASA